MAAKKHGRFTIEVKKPFTDIISGKLYGAGDIIEIDEEDRLINIIGQGLGTLVAAHTPYRAKSGNKIMVYQNWLYKIGGIETANYNLAKTYKNRKITFVFRVVDINQVLRIAKYCDVIIDRPTTEYSTDVLILANFDAYQYIQGRVKARKIYQQIHADWVGLKEFDGWANFDWQPAADVDKVLAVSETTKEGLKKAFSQPIDSVVVPNILGKPDEDDFRMFLTMSRLSTEKGGSRMIQMLKAFHKAGKHFLWLIFAEQDAYNTALYSQFMADPSVVIIKPSLNNTQLLRKVDYLVQLSDNESFCYSVHEALQVGTPVIGTNIPELAKAIKPGKNGYLVEKDLSNLDIEKIFNEVPTPKPIKEILPPIWDKVLGGQL